MPSIMDMFRSKVEPAAVVQPTTQQHVEANPTIPNSSTPRPDGSNPAIPAVAAEGEKSPFETYKDLWKPPANGQTEGVPNSVPNFGLDPEKLQIVAKGIDFTAGLTSATIEAAFGKDSPEIRTILNHIGQQGFVQNFSAGAKTVEEAMKRNTADLTGKTIPEIIRRHSISELNRSTGSLFTDPATAPFMQTLETQMANKFPNASPTEIRDHAANYYNTMVDQSVKSSGKMIVDRPKSNGQDNQDWDKWAGEDARTN